MTVQRNICKCDFVYPHNQHSICPVWHFSPDTVMHMMGADAGITQLGRTYTRIFLLFTPFLWWIMCFLRLSATTMLRPSPWLERWWEVFQCCPWLCVYVSNGDGTGRSSTCHNSLSDRQHINLQYSFLSEEKYGTVCKDQTIGTDAYSILPAGVPAFVGEFSSGVTTTLLITWF